MRKVQNAGWFSKGILTHGRKSNNTIMIPKKMNNNNNKKRKTSSSSSFFLMISRTRFILKKKKPTYTQVLTDNNFFVCVSHLFSDKSWFPLLKLFLLYTNVKYSHDAPLFSSSFLLQAVYQKENKKTPREIKAPQYFPLQRPSSGTPRKLPYVEFTGFFIIIIIYVFLFLIFF